MSEKDLREALAALVEERRREAGSHPVPEEIVAYHAGEASSERASEIRRHLVLCRECAALVLDLDRFVRDAAGEKASGEQPAAGPWPAGGSGRASEERRPGPPRWLGLAAAAAAAIFTAHLLLQPREEPLPTYEARLSGQRQASRAPAPGEADALPTFAPGSRLHLKLQPEVAAGAVSARAYLRLGGESRGAVRALSATTWEISPEGVVSLEGEIGRDLHLPAGRIELFFALARPSALPSRRHLERALAGGEKTGRGWRLLGRELEVEAGDGRAAAEEAASWVEYAGCQTVLAGPVCVLPEDRQLNFWVRPPTPAGGEAGCANGTGTEIRVDAGGRPPPAEAEVQDGCRYRVDVAPGCREVVVEAESDGRQWVWMLELAESEPAASSAALGRLWRDEVRAGQIRRAEAAFDRTLAAHRRAGRLWDELDEATGWAYHLIAQRRFAAARELLAELSPEALGGYAPASQRLAYYRGLLAEETGDLRGAMAQMSEAALAAGRAGLDRERLFAEDLLARQLRSAGLDEAADSRLAALWEEIGPHCGASEHPAADLSLDPCDCANFRTNLAWARLLAREAGRPGPDPAPLLREAEDLLLGEAAGEGGCALTEPLPNIRLNLGLAALHRGDPAEARRYAELAGAEIASAPLPRLELWQLDLEARILLDEARADEALELYERLSRLAERGSSPEAAWRASYGRALALGSLGRVDEALLACAEAEELLDGEGLRIPMHRGREPFLAQRRRATRFCLDLLLREGRAERALRLARRSTARALANLRAEARLAELDAGSRRLWEEGVALYHAERERIESLEARLHQGLPLDEERRLAGELEARRRELLGHLDRAFDLLGESPAAAPAPPPPGALLLAYHPLPAGWAAFAADREEIEALRIELAPEAEAGAGRRASLPPPKELGRRLLDPFADRIARADEVQIVARGVLRELDFHALPFAGGILLETAPVLYRVDLPARALEAARSPPTAVVVHDPTLPGSAAEAEEVRRALTRRGWRPRVFDQAELSAERLLPLLAEAELFHFAGHADFDDESLGWESSLHLAGGSRLGVGDILAGARAPRWVVLSSCRSGAESRQLPLATIGLAQAFLAAGSERVLAATAEVSDRDAARLAEALYRHSQGPTLLAEALRRAQLELRAKAPETRWQDFRVLGS